MLIKMWHDNMKDIAVVSIKSKTIWQRQENFKQSIERWFDDE